MKHYLPNWRNVWAFCLALALGALMVGFAALIIAGGKPYPEEEANVFPEAAPESGGR